MTRYPAKHVSTLNKLQTVREIRSSSESVGGDEPLWRLRPHLADAATRARVALPVLSAALERLKSGWSPTYGSGKSLIQALQGDIEAYWARKALLPFIHGIDIAAWESAPQRERRDVLRALERAIAALGGGTPRRRGGWSVTPWTSTGRPNLSRNNGGRK